MNLLDRWTTTSTGYKRAYEDYIPLAELSITNPPNMDINLPPFANEYRVEARIGVSFVANKAQYDSALQNAKQMVLRHIYGDLEMPLRMAVSAIYAHDCEAALPHLSIILKRILGENE